MAVDAEQAGREQSARARGEGTLRRGVGRQHAEARRPREDIAPVPESVSRSMMTSSARSPKRFNPALSKAASR